MVLRLAWRSLWRQRRRTLITLSSIVLGLTFAFFFVSLAEGVYTKTVNEVARMQAGHLTLEHPEYRIAPSVDLQVSGASELRRQLEALPDVDRVKSLVLGQGVARSGHGAVGVAVMGIEPSVERATSPLANHVVQGSYLEDGDQASVLIGRQLARRLHLAEGKKLVLTVSSVRGEIVEELCRVKGIFETGSEEVDGYLLQGPLSFVRDVYAAPGDRVTQIGVLLKSPGAKGRTRDLIAKIVQGREVVVRPWEEVLPDLAAWIRLDRGSHYVFQSLLLLVILFTIFNTILMSVLERQREFAVLLSLGTPTRQLQAQVMLESVLLGILGCAGGLALGSLVSYVAHVYGIDLRRISPDGMTVSGYAVSLELRPEITLPMFFWLGGAVFAATVVLTLIPVRRISRVSIAETLR